MKKIFSTCMALFLLGTCIMMGCSSEAGESLQTPPTTIETMDEEETTEAPGNFEGTLQEEGSSDGLKKETEDSSVETESEKSTAIDQETPQEEISDNSASDGNLEKDITYYERVYSPVLNEYIWTLENPDELTDETKVPRSFRDKVQLYSLSIDDIYYVFIDLDNDNTDEMIILNRSFGDDYICAVYTLENERIIPVEFSAARMERDGMYLYDNSIVGINAGGSGYVKKCFCRLDSETLDWRVVETIVMVSDWEIDDSTKYYRSMAQESRMYDPEDNPEIYTEITEKEMNTTESGFEVDPHIDRKPLAEYTYK